MRQRGGARVAAGRLLRLAGALTLTGATLVGSGGSASATGIGPQYTGWWFEAQQLLVPLPAPVVPDGGMLVQQGATGPTAYGGVHYALPVSHAAGTLLLDVATGSTAAVGTLQACVTTRTWTATHGPGAWSSRPTYGAHCVVGIAATDGSAVAFSFDPSMVKGTALDLAIVPAAGATPFSVTFNKPATDSLQLATLPAAAPTTPAVAPSAAPSSGDSQPAAAPQSSPSAASFPTVSAPVLTASPPTTVGAAPRASIRLVASPPLLGASPSDKRAQRIAAVLGLLALVVGWWLVGARPARPPRLLGALAGDAGVSLAGVGGSGGRTVGAVGGIGRFARPRSVRPRRLL